MDCEKFESALMDELYGELDELTGAAAKRHVSGCARCAALIGGLRATRRVAAVPWVEPPAGLERRILAAAAAATPKSVPLRGRLARAVSLAGSWAMRPQTAMAAVFLVMIGTSVLLLRGKSSRAPASAEMTVTEEGTPAPATPSAAAPAAEPASPVVTTVPSAFAIARPAERMAPAPTTGWAAPPAADSPLDDLQRTRIAAKAAGKGDDGAGAMAQNAARGASGAGFAAPPPPAAPPAVAMPSPVMAGGAPGGAYASAPSEAEASPATAATAAVDPSDELWAARASRDAALRQGHPCPSGPHFDDVASRSPGTQAGWDALYEGALCYESLGEFGNARTRLGTLLGVPSYRDRARATLDRIGREQQGGGAAARAAASKASAPPPPAAAPADAVH
jgi:hypothetical protein